MTGGLRIVHCFRAPVGGVFRHVRDLARAQAAAGHSVGILCDATTGGEYEDSLFASIRKDLALGIIRIPMRRNISPGDIFSAFQAYRKLRAMRPDVIHSHGAKGGAYARLIGTALRWTGRRTIRLYCPHGGSIYFDAATAKGKAYFAFEKILQSMTDRLIFVSDYERQGYIDKIGTPRCPTSLVYNGLGPDEFETVPLADDAADFLFIGTIRDLKGPDVFLEALAKLRRRGENATAHFVGDGEDKQACLDQIRRLGVEDAVSVHPAMPARKAFAMARTVVIPSRAESLPYIVLEAIAAGRPVIATNVGGIPEIFAGEFERLIAPGDADALAEAMASALHKPETASAIEKRRDSLAERFSVAVMAKSVEDAYRATF